MQDLCRVSGTVQNQRQTLSCMEITASTIMQDSKN